MEKPLYAAWVLMLVLGLRRGEVLGPTRDAMFANPKSGNQGRVARDGALEAWDTHLGGGRVSPDDPAKEVLATCLYHFRAVAYCCAGADLRLADARPILGSPDVWMRLPERDYWA
ncbi:hypothetical protein MTP10_06025 [Nonomuraea sp. 3-1Str]|uniref:hypothetical protein n=1 Tax=Nonomuraea sp. 3-1Str TaxID=2929801 RepID=UPI00285B6624|nr:hypothetical protein [Nonomuraea sp. 3-1Str]MDR8408288.1 hypothetical protein [Nonomuraea sp. 3-1Str]